MFLVHNTHTKRCLFADNQIYFDVQIVIAYDVYKYIYLRIHLAQEKMEQKFYSNLFHPKLRKWQKSNVKISSISGILQFGINKGIGYIKSSIGK